MHIYNLRLRAIALCLVCMLVLSLNTVSAPAKTLSGQRATAESIKKPQNPRYSGGTQYTLYGYDWYKVYTKSSSTTTKTIYISSQNLYGYLDVRMIGWDGSIVWQANGWIPPGALYQEFYLGTDVRYVQLRITNATPIYAAATVYW